MKEKTYTVHVSASISRNDEYRVIARGAKKAGEIAIKQFEAAHGNGWNDIRFKAIADLHKKEK